MVVVAVRKRDRVDGFRTGAVEKREPLPALPLGMDPGVEQEPIAIVVHEPRTRPDVAVGVQVGDLHPATVGLVPRATNLEISRGEDFARSGTKR